MTAVRRLLPLVLIAGCGNPPQVTDTLTMETPSPTLLTTPSPTASPSASPRPKPRATRTRAPLVKKKRATRARSYSGGTRVESTAYCLTGRMANGRRTYQGAVAGNRWPLGTRLWVSDSPYGAGIFTVADRIGHGSSLDFAMPGDCSGARQWGRRTVRVREAS